jgi:uncharacterized DUF497 family protein
VLDDTEDYGEERFLVIGMVEGQLLSVVYTPTEALSLDLGEARNQR